MAKDTKVDVVVGAESLVVLEELAKWAEHVDIAYAWVSSGKGKAPHWRALEGKIRRAVVGDHFNQTEPAALRFLADANVLRIYERPGGVFHPKIALAVKGDSAMALVGSSNLTGGGFGRNTELNLWIDGPRSKGPLFRIAAFMDQLWESDYAFEPDAAWLDRYEAAYDEARVFDALPAQEEAQELPPRSVRPGFTPVVSEMDDKRFDITVRLDEDQMLAQLWCNYDSWTQNHPEDEVLKMIQKRSTPLWNGFYRGWNRPQYEKARMALVRALNRFWSEWRPR